MLNHSSSVLSATADQHPQDQQLNGHEEAEGSVQQHLAALREQQSQYQQWILGYWLSAAGVDSAAALETPGDDAQHLLSAIYSSATCRGYVEMLKQSMEMARTLEKQI